MTRQLIDIWSCVAYRRTWSCHRSHTDSQVSQNCGQPREHRSCRRDPFCRSEAQVPEVPGSVPGRVTSASTVWNRPTLGWEYLIEAIATVETPDEVLW